MTNDDRSREIISTDTTAQSPSTNAKRRKCTTNKILRASIILALTAIIIFVIIDSSSTDKHVKNALLNFMEWVKHHPVEGVFAFIVVKSVATVLFVPGFILAIGCGFAFGMTFGRSKGVALSSISVFLGACIGSILAFLLGRYLFKDCVMNLTKKYPVVQAIFRALEGNGVKIMILLRLSPLIPYNTLSYICGVTAISIWSYSFALLGMLPGVVLFCLIGTMACSLVEIGMGKSDNSIANIISITCGIVFAILGVVVTSYYAKRELNQIIAIDKDDEEKLQNQEVASTSDRVPAIEKDNLDETTMQQLELTAVVGKLSNDYMTTHTRSTEEASSQRTACSYEEDL